MPATTPAIPAFDVVNRRPCTVTVPVEYCSDVPACRVHHVMPDLIASLSDVEDRRLTHDLANAPLLVQCPRCGSVPGWPCVTASGFVGGIGGPHAARRKLIVAMTVAEVRDGWAAIRAERAESRAQTEALFARQRCDREIDAAARRVLAVTPADALEDLPTLAEAMKRRVGATAGTTITEGS